MASIPGQLNVRQQLNLGPQLNFDNLVQGLQAVVAGVALVPNMQLVGHGDLIQ